MNFNLNLIPYIKIILELIMDLHVKYKGMKVLGKYSSVRLDVEDLTLKA